MKKTNNTKTEEKTTKTSLLKPFPLVENENYLLKMADGIYVTAVWGEGCFYNEYHAERITNEIESYIAIKDLGL